MTEKGGIDVAISRHSEGTQFHKGCGEARVSQSALSQTIRAVEEGLFFGY
jgi:hypothetical protein